MTQPIHCSRNGLHPAKYRPKLAIIHEGIDTQLLAPKPDQSFNFPDEATLDE